MELIIPFFSTLPLIIQQLTVSLLSIGIIVPYLQKRTVKKTMKRINGSKGGLKAVDGKIDKALLRRAVNDITDTSNPSGALLQFFPSMTGYLKENPSSVVGFIRLVDNIGNLGNLKNLMMNPTGTKQPDPQLDYNKYR